MPRVLSLSNHTTITIEDTAFASGGEGDIYRIVLPTTRQNQVVKIYKPSKRTAEREQKIKYLIEHPPFLPDNPAQSNLIVWATEAVYEKNDFVGFVMPAAQGIKLEMLCQPKLPSMLGAEWQRLSFQQPESLNLRLKLCYNIALAVAYLHRFGEYALIDLKPDNILVQQNGNISIIDIDSLAVFDEQKLRFMAPVITPDFAPPEYYKGIKPDVIKAGYVWDRYSIAIIFYRLLCGIHPFVGTCAPPLDGVTDISGKIERGLFVNGKNKVAYSVIPPPHQQFERLPNHIKTLLIQCFDNGHSQTSERPSSEDWYIGILTHLSQIPADKILPSRSIKTSIPQTARPLRLSEEIVFPTPIKLLNLQESAVFSSRKSLDLIRKIMREEQKITILFNQINQFKKLYEQVMAQFEEQQVHYIKQEKKYLNQLIGLFGQKLTQLDKEAIRIYQAETSALQQHDAQVQQQLAAAEQSVNDFITTQLQPAEAPYQQSIDTIRQQLNALIAQEQGMIQSYTNEIQRKIDAQNNIINSLVNGEWQTYSANFTKTIQKLVLQRRTVQEKGEKEKQSFIKAWQEHYIWLELAKYRITDYAHSIFTDAAARPREIAMLFSRYGINTAADFETVTSTGRVLMRLSKKSVKLPGIGSSRTQALMQWQQRIKNNVAAQAAKAIAQQSPAAHIVRNYTAQLQELQRSEDDIRARMEADKKERWQKISTQHNLPKKEQAWRQELVQKIISIKDMFISKKQPLEAKIAAIEKQRDEATKNIRQALATLQADCLRIQNNIKSKGESRKKNIIKQYKTALAAIIDREKLYLQQQIQHIKSETNQLLEKNLTHHQNLIQPIRQKALPLLQQIHVAQEQLIIWQREWSS